MGAQKKSSTGRVTRRRRVGMVLLGLVAVLMAQLGLMTTANAATVQVGPVDPATGFPAWVAAGDDRLDLCLDGPYCLGTAADLVSPGGEAFWFQAAATLTGSVDGAVEMASEAAFADAGPDQEVGFNRIRVRLALPSPGRYRVDYPYGSKTYDVDGGLEINDTQDVGCLTPDCGDFAEMTDSGDGGVGGSFLRWDPAVAPAAPTGYLGDAVTEHKVVGSPLGRNHVSVVRLGTDAAGNAVETEVARTDLFSVQGKLARPRVLATPVAGSYRTGFTARLVGTEPGAVLWYTTDGSEPATAAGLRGPTASVYTTAGIPVSADTTIKAVNARSSLAVTDPVTGQPAAATTTAYVIDDVAPTLEGTPASDTYSSAQHLTLTATDTQDPAPRIFYTRALVPPGGQDPADPTAESTPYTGRIPINGNLDEAKTVVKAIAYDAAGNASAVMRREYTINAPNVSASPAGGSFGTAVDVTLAATDPAAAIYYTTDGQDPVVNQDPATMQVTSVEHGTRYTNDPIRLTDYTTLKFLAASTAGQSTVMTEDYYVDIPANRTGDNLAAVGPVDSAHGYPFWYADHGDSDAGLEPVRLELCLDDPLCPVVGERPNPGAPTSYPDNFPGESFWWSGEAAMDLPGGGSALLVLAQEAAFTTEDATAGEQIAFARLRIRLDDVRPDTRYTVTTPYGVDIVTSDDRGRARMTEDIGCLTTPCTAWDAPLDGRVGPFLRWDPAVAPAAPEGYVGNPLVEHQVVGSPHGTNFFRVEGPGIGGTGVDRVETDRFAVQGKLAELRASASPRGDRYATAQDVRIQASFPTEAKIVWTTDGTDPAVDPAGEPVGDTRQFVPDGSSADPSALVRIGDGLTTLKFMAVDLTDPSVTSDIYTERYEVEGTLPTVTASLDPANGPFQGAQQVSLSSSVPDIFYTTDNSKPTLDAAGLPAGTTRAYEGPITVGRSSSVKAFAVSALGTVGPVATFTYDIVNLQAVGATSPVTGFPSWYQDFGASGLPAAKVELCVDDPLCPIVGDLPDAGQPVSFPGNFPDEAFWWVSNASFGAGAIDARLDLAAEAAFASAEPQAGQQIAFARIRVRVDGLVPGATYRVVHPYGEAALVADADGVINSTDDTGCLSAPCTFSQMLRGPIGPFLRWDTGAPTGYLGDGATPHSVVGSPYGTNEFRIEQLTAADGSALATPTPVGGTDQFVVQGKLAELRAEASPTGGTFTTAQTVRLTANEPGAVIRYTLDGSIPTSTSPQYSGPLTISAQGQTTLRFAAFGPDGTSSDPVTETYVIDSVAPTVSADLPAGTYPTAQSVTLSTDDPTAVIHYTTNGSTPTTASPRYTGPVTVAQSLTLRARAFDPAGNASEIGSWTYTIGLATSSLTLGTPSPATVDLGQVTTLSGRLMSGATGIGNAAVALQSRAIGQTVWQATGTSATTAADGRWSITGLRPTATTDYRVVYAGGPQAQGSTSAVQRVAVRAVLTMNPLNQVRRNRNVTIAGTLNPAHPGTQVTVRFTLAGQRSPAAVTANVAANGTWTVTTRAPNRQGGWTVTASWAGDADHLGDTVTRTLNVVR